MNEFRSKGRTFMHVANGWCAREIDKRDRSGTVWRMFYGVLQPGADHPTYVSAFQDEDSEYVEFPEFEGVLGWLKRRIKVKP